MLQQFGQPIGVIVLCILLMVGSIILINRTVLFQNRLLGERSSFEFVLLFIGWILLFIFMVILGLFLFIFLFLFLFIYMQNLRIKQQGFLWMLAISAKRQIPLAPAISAYAQEVGGQFGDRIDDFANMLSAGVPLPDALGSVPLLVSNRFYPIIRTSYESGNMAKGLREAAVARDLQQPLWGVLSGKIFYILAMVMFGTSILTFIMIKIIPAFEKIFKDFSTKLPPITIALINISHWMVNFWYLFCPLFFAIFLLFFYSLLKFLGISLFELPGVSFLMRRKHTAEIMDNLAMTVENRRTIDAGIQTLVDTYPDNSIRFKLNLALSDIRSGASWYESLYRRGLMRQSDLAVLQSAERVGNLPWAMREMADSNRRRIAYRMNVLMQTMFPPVVLSFGVMVMLIVVALFMPLITLITQMS
jgi:type II secretory pathway component PulF